MYIKTEKIYLTLIVIKKPDGLEFFGVNNNLLINIKNMKEIIHKIIWKLFYFSSKKLINNWVWCDFLAMKISTNYKELNHYKDTTIWLYCIDRNPKEVNLKWIRENNFRLK